MEAQDWPPPKVGSVSIANYNQVCEERSALRAEVDELKRCIDDLVDSEEWLEQEVARLTESRIQLLHRAFRNTQCKCQLTHNPCFHCEIGDELEQLLSGKELHNRRDNVSERLRQDDEGDAGLICRRTAWRSRSR